MSMNRLYFEQEGERYVSHHLLLRVALTEATYMLDNMSAKVIAVVSSSGKEWDVAAIEAWGEAHHHEIYQPFSGETEVWRGEMWKVVP